MRVSPERAVGARAVGVQAAGAQATGAQATGARGPSGRAGRAGAAQAARRWPLGGVGAGARLDARAVGELTVFELGGRPALSCGAQARFAQAGRERVLLAALLEGGCGYRGAGEGFCELAAGEVLVALCAAPLELRGQAGARLCGLAMPAHLIVPRFVSAERLAAAAGRSHGRGVAPVLHGFLAWLPGAGGAGLGPGALCDAVGGLLAAMLEDCLSVASAPAGGAGRVHLEEIGRHLRRHFAEPGLSACDVAEAVGVSRRYLHRIYAEEKRSFRGELVALRIEACVKAFLDEQQAERTIAEIAFSAGYADISQFNRHFRRLKGATPSAVRKAALADLAAAEAPIRPPRRAG